MAITAQTFSTLPSGAPSLGSSGQYAYGAGDVQEPAFVGVVQFTGDGSTTAGVVNFISGGTSAIPFTPTAVIASVYGGGTAAASIAAVSTSSISNESFTVNFSAAPASSATINVLCQVYK